jgi:hypothetical protein
MAIRLDDVVINYGFQLVILRDVNVSGITKHSRPFFGLEVRQVTLTCSNHGKPVVKYNMKLCHDGTSLKIQDKWHCV